MSKSALICFGENRRSNSLNLDKLSCLWFYLDRMIHIIIESKKKPERRDELQVLQVVFYLVMPYFITKALEKWKKLGIISPILLCYVIGIILGNLSFLPIDRQLAFSLSEYSVPVAIPLILATDAVLVQISKKQLFSW